MTASRHAPPKVIKSALAGGELVEMIRRTLERVAHLGLVTCPATYHQISSA
jgi:hypothetical protein